MMQTLLRNDSCWSPRREDLQKAHITEWMKELRIDNLTEFHRWSFTNYESFWQKVVERLGIVFHQPYHTVCDLNHGIEKPNWFAGAKMNITESCFLAPKEKIAIIQQRKNKSIEKITYGELNQLANQVAFSLQTLGFSPGDAIAINMPMTISAVAIYLGIIKMGGVVVSIADSFSADEIAIRLRLANTKAIFTQDIIFREQKRLPLFEKIVQANAPLAIVLPAEHPLHCSLRNDDLSWQDFLKQSESEVSYSSHPMANCNILFSSGTTGDPKAIPWTHSTMIKTAADAYFHHDIHADDILAWPTNLGWMMGPWLIFATFINQATMALYDGVARDRDFGQFIQDTKVTMLGVVPTLVAHWRQTRCMEEFDWSAIQRYSSTGECSNPTDMAYLMSLAKDKPIIEYCGGTEIGGAYISSTLVENNYPSRFTTPTFGLNFVLLDEAGNISDKGEVALVPPSIGLSTELLNTSHHEVYYAGMPTFSDGTILRRHGDQIIQVGEREFYMLGRMDDTMNLSGIKVSSAEIERALHGLEGVQETAAVAITPLNLGPSQLVIFATGSKSTSAEQIKKQMQQRIHEVLNPLFKIHEVVLLNELPKTASNKIMRRVLRDNYMQSQK